MANPSQEVKRTPISQPTPNSVGQSVKPEVELALAELRGFIIKGVQSGMESHTAQDVSVAIRRKLDNLEAVIRVAYGDSGD